MKIKPNFTFSEVISIYNSTINLYKKIPSDVRGSNLLTDDVKEYYISLRKLILVGQDYYNNKNLAIAEIEKLIRADVCKIKDSKENKKTK